METKISKDLNICNSVIFYSWVIFNVTVSYFIPGFHFYLEGMCKYLALMVLLTSNIINFGFFLRGEFFDYNVLEHSQVITGTDIKRYWKV